MSKTNVKVRVSAIIFYENQLVVTKHFVEGFGEYYLLPGGGLEIGESPNESIERECREELGVEILIERLLYYKTGYTDKETYLELIFLCKCKEFNFNIPSNEENVKEIHYIKSEKELRNINFFPKQIIDKVFKKLPLSPEFLGKFEYPEK